MIALSNNEKAFFALVESGLWNRPCRDLSLFPLADADWKEIIAIASKQTVLGLLYSGVTMLPQELMPGPAILMRLLGNADALERTNRQIIAIAGRLAEVLNAHGIPAILLKGAGIAATYPNPLLRGCGDIDLYFSSAELRQQAADAINEAFHPTDMVNHVCNAINFSVDGIEVELHTHIFDFHTHGTLDFIMQSTSGEHYVDSHLCDTATVLVPCPLFQLLSVNTHIAKHAFVLGIGLRQLCDYARACHTYKNSIDRKLFADIMHKGGLYKWNTLLQSLLHDYLGMSPDDFITDEPIINSDRFASMVIANGNFGHHVAGRKEILASGSVLRRKLNTIAQTYNCAKFALRIAPREFIGNTLYMANKTIQEYVKKHF